MTTASSTNDIDGSKALKLKLPALIAHSAPAIPVTKPEIPSAIEPGPDGGRPWDEASAGLSRLATMARPTELLRTDRRDRTVSPRTTDRHRVEASGGRDPHAEQVGILEAHDRGGVVGEDPLAEQPAASGERERQGDDAGEQPPGPDGHGPDQHARHRGRRAPDAISIAGIPRSSVSVAV